MFILQLYAYVVVVFFTTILYLVQTVLSWEDNLFEVKRE